MEFFPNLPDQDPIKLLQGEPVAKGVTMELQTYGVSIGLLKEGIVKPGFIAKRTGINPYYGFPIFCRDAFYSASWSSFSGTN